MKRRNFLQLGAVASLFGFGGNAVAKEKIANNDRNKIALNIEPHELTQFFHLTGNKVTSIRFEKQADGTYGVEIMHEPPPVYFVEPNTGGRIQHSPIHAPNQVPVLSPESEPLDYDKALRDAVEQGFPDGESYFGVS